MGISLNQPGDSHGTVSGNFFVGAFNASFTGTPAAGYAPSWSTFCTDMGAYLHVGNWGYSQVPVTASTPLSGAGQPDWDANGIQRAAYLYGNNIGALADKSGADRRAYAAAMQLALWEVLYDSASSTYSLAAGDFRATSGVTTEVQNYFAGMTLGLSPSSATPSVSGVDWWRPDLKPGTQDLGSQGLLGSQAVPEALNTGMATLGVLAAGWLGRRKLARAR